MRNKTVAVIGASRFGKLLFAEDDLKMEKFITFENEMVNRDFNLDYSDR